MYFEYDEYYGGENICNLNLKRPFGNSNVMNDITEEYFNSLSNEELKAIKVKYNNEDVSELIWLFIADEEEFLYKIYLETLNICGFANKELHLTSLIYKNTRNFSLDFVPTKEGEDLYRKHQRKYKFKRLLS